MIGVLSTVAYVLVMAIIVFTIIDKTVGLRVTKEEELDGLDIHEHGCSAYADFPRFARRMACTTYIILPLLILQHDRRFLTHHQ